MFHSQPQSCIYPCRTTYMETKQMGNSTNLAGKIEHAQFTVQGCARYPARLHASHCATLQRVGYLARCCTQYIARYLARNIASCRQAFNFAQGTSVFKNRLSFGIHVLIPSTHSRLIYFKHVHDQINME